MHFFGLLDGQLEQAERHRCALRFANNARAVCQRPPCGSPVAVWLMCRSLSFPLLLFLLHRLAVHQKQKLGPWRVVSVACALAVHSAAGFMSWRHQQADGEPPIVSTAVRPQSILLRCGLAVRQRAATSWSSSDLQRSSLEEFIWEQLDELHMTVQFF